MNFFSETGLKDFGAQKARKSSYSFANAEARSLLIENSKAKYPIGDFDIFLSYSSLDWVVIFGVYSTLVDKGFTVYVDRIEDPQLDRTNVTPETAEILRKRMKKCRSLLFCTTTNLSASKWLPWEVGYFDGFRGKVAIIPITTDVSFKGQEYLGLYPFAESDLYLWYPDGLHLLASLKNWLAAA